MFVSLNKFFRCSYDNVERDSPSFPEIKNVKFNIKKALMDDCSTVKNKEFLPADIE